VVEGRANRGSRSRWRDGASQQVRPRSWHIETYRHRAAVAGTPRSKSAVISNVDQDFHRPPVRSYKTEVTGFERPEGLRSPRPTRAAHSLWRMLARATDVSVDCPLGVASRAYVRRCSIPLLEVRCSVWR